MMIAGASLGSVALGGVVQDPGGIIDPASYQPIRIDLNGVDVSEQVEVESIRKTDTLGQPVAASLRFINPIVNPVAGDQVRIRYYESVEFAGTINRVNKNSGDLRAVYFDCECMDWGQVLTRRQVRRNFTNLNVQEIVESVLENELAGEEITIGTLDSRVVVPLVDASKSARAFDLFRDLANATGQTFRVGFDKSIQMTSSTVEAAPLVLNEANTLVVDTGATRDRETYRNRQTIQIVGTSKVQGEDPLTVTVTVDNAEQIAERQAIEGGTGVYEEFEEITHPTSNRIDDLTLMAEGYAEIRLATAGTLRTTLSVKARGYGFRAGQIATVDLPTFGLSGEFVIQRVVLSEGGREYLFHDLELTESSVQRRAYESWIQVLSKGKITIQLFGAIAHDSVSFSTAGSFNFNLPAGVTVYTVTAKGASAGGGGGTNWSAAPSGGFCNVGFRAVGGRGGNGGKAVSTVNVITDGEEINITIGAKGVHGNGGFKYKSPCTGTPTATDGAEGTITSVFRNGISLAEAYTGKKGKASVDWVGVNPQPGAAGASGSGSGAIVTVGGGKTGGAGGAIGTFSGPGLNGGDGMDGEVIIEW